MRTYQSFVKLLCVNLYIIPLIFTQEMREESRKLLHHKHRFAIVFSALRLLAESLKAVGSASDYLRLNELYIETVANYSNRIPDTENFEFLVIFVARIPHFASQSVQIQGKLKRQLYFATV